MAGSGGGGGGPTNYARREGREEDARGTEDSREEQGKINREDIRRYSPAVLDEICQTARRAPICSAACLYHDKRAVGGSRRSFCYTNRWMVVIVATSDFIRLLNARGLMPCLEPARYICKSPDTN